MNHQQTLIGRLLCDLHELSFFLPMAFNVQALYSVLASEVHFCTLCSVTTVNIFYLLNQFQLIDNVCLACVLLKGFQSQFFSILTV